jgi:hypothetical protein
VSEEDKEKLRDSPIGKNLDLESKLSMRDKQKSKKTFDDEMDKLFEEKTGIKD